MANKFEVFIGHSVLCTLTVRFLLELRSIQAQRSTTTLPRADVSTNWAVAAVQNVAEDFSDPCEPLDDLLSLNSFDEYIPEFKAKGAY
jgi:hypothetical protein